jgi:hypothetical protein
VNRPRLAHACTAALALAAALSSAPLRAQTPVTFGLGATVSSPTGELANGWRSGLGGALTADLELDRRWSLNVALHQIRFGGTSANTPGPIGAKPDLDATGLTAGARSFVSGGDQRSGGVYLASDLGWYRFSSRDPVSRERTEERELGILPTLGYKVGSFDMAAQLKLGGRYQWIQFRGALNLVRW